jgi:hypothetical protein
MTKIFSPVLIGILTLMLISACTSAPPEALPIEEKLASLGYLMGPQVKRINDFQINSWSIVDRKKVIIFVGAGHRYLITTRNPCDGLQETEHLDYSTTNGNLTDTDKLLVRRHSGHMQSCFIDTLYELEQKAR